MISLGPAVHLLTNISRILLVLALLHTTARGGVAGVAEPAYLVTRVVDGDTIVVEGIGKVRLIGVDTPETVDPRRPVQRFGREASAFTKRLVEGKQVPDGTFVNEEIIGAARSLGTRA